MTPAFSHMGGKARLRNTSNRKPCDKPPEHGVNFFLISASNYLIIKEIERFLDIDIERTLDGHDLDIARSL